MIRLVTFASDDMSKSAELCVSSALRMGVQDYDLWNYEDLIDCPSPLNRIRIEERGMGYWAWKPFIVDDLIHSTATKDGDLIIYADAGVEFIEPVQTIIDSMDQDIWLFGNEHQHAHWCKRDVVCEVWNRNTRQLASYRPGYWEAATDLLDFAEDGGVHWPLFGKQAQASVIFFRVNDYTRKLVKEWLHWCLFEGGRLIDDSPSRTPNHPEFKENRHDQAILTTMAYREGIKLHEWFVKYEGYTPGRMTGYPRELGRPFVFHHRRRNHEWEGVAA